MDELTSVDLVGNALHIGDEIVFHTKRLGGYFGISTVVKIEKDVEQSTTQGWVKCDKIHFKQRRALGYWLMSKPNIEVIKIIREVK